MESVFVCSHLTYDRCLVPVVKFRWRNRSPSPTCRDSDVPNCHKFSRRDLRRNYGYHGSNDSSTFLSII